MNRGKTPSESYVFREERIMKKLVFALFVVSALAACGKKKGSSGGGGPAAGPGPAGVCQLNAQGQCVGGVNMNTGYVGRNVWNGNIGIVNPQKYMEFMTQNGLCHGIQCTSAGGMYNFFELTVKTERETLPGTVKFWITPVINGNQGRTLGARAQGYINGANNGFQMVYTRTINNCPPGSMCIQGQPQYQQQRYDQYGRPMILPYGAPNQPNALVAPQTTTLQIVLTYNNQPQQPTYGYNMQQVAQVSVVYMGVEIGRGQVMAQYRTQQYSGYPQQNSQLAPEVAPYMGTQRY